MTTARFSNLNFVDSTRRRGSRPAMVSINSSSVPAIVAIASTQPRMIQRISSTLFLLLPGREHTKPVSRQFHLHDSAAPGQSLFCHSHEFAFLVCRFGRGSNYPQ